MTALRFGPAALAPVVTEFQLPDFGLALTFATDHTVIAVRGELDLLTAPTFADLLDVALARPGCGLVVDFARLTFIDARGLGQLARALTRLRNEGNHMAITSPSPMVYKLLALTGFSELASITRPAYAQPDPVPSQARAAALVDALAVNQPRQLVSVNRGSGGVAQ